MTLNVGDYFERTVSDECATRPSFIRGYRGRVVRITDGCYWDEDGSGHSENCIRKIDPPNAGPVRTVTRKEIVPGTYGRIEVLDSTNDGAQVRIDGPHPVSPHLWLTPVELRAAASTLIEIADALESETPE
jgi:hypothetical protein